MPLYYIWKFSFDKEIVKYFLQFDIDNIMSLTELLFTELHLFEVLLDDFRTILRYKNRNITDTFSNYSRNYQEKLNDIFSNDQRSLAYNFHTEKREEKKI